MPQSQPAGENRMGTAKMLPLMLGSIMQYHQFLTNTLPRLDLMKSAGNAKVALFADV